MEKEIIYTFLTFTFIAQLIILYNIVKFLISVDNKVVEINNSLLVNKDFLFEAIKEFRKFTLDLKFMVRKFKFIATRLKRKYILKIIKELIINTGIIISKPKYRKILFLYRYGKKILNKILFNMI